MATTLAQKLRIKEGDGLFPINAPAGFKKNLGPLPSKVKIVETAADANQLHWFVLNKQQLEKELTGILKKLKPDVFFWIYYPKGSSKIQTDLTRDKGWDALLKNPALHWISLISFDETWSTFACRWKNEADKKKDAQPKVREIFDYIDPKAKTVRLPEDLAAAFEKNKKAASTFNALSYSCRKEYVEWIITAKREETRADRIKGTIERVNKGWKNPANS
ncbi:YdeI/OmpD-associated family protein [soil metagenome]